MLSHQAELQGHTIYIPSKSQDTSSGHYPLKESGVLNWTNYV